MDSTINRFMLRQKITAFVNRYEVYTYDGTATGQMLALAEQKRLKIKEEIVFYTDETKSSVLFSLKAEKALDIHGRFFILDGHGAQLGYLKKDFLQSIGRSTWYLHDPSDRMLLTARERNVAIALLRRFGGELLSLLPFNFDLLGENQAVVGRIQRKFGLRDQYDFQLDAGAPEFDRRLAIALGIALDALQAR